MTKPSQEFVEVHNVYTLYELNPDGSASEQGILTFFRPQDWGDKNRWHYHQCRIEFESNQVTYINNCHLWQELERAGAEAFQVIAPSLFMVLMPGNPQELSGNTHLGTDDFWCDDWGRTPPCYDSDDEWVEY